MQIRNQLLLITILSALFAALATGYISIVRSDVKNETYTEAFLEIYNSSWLTIVEQESEGLLDYGPEGSRGSFWLSDNENPLDFRPARASNYLVDQSASLEDKIINPLHTSLRDKDVNTQTRYLKIFFGPGLQRGDLYFYSILDAQSLNQVVCKKSIFARQFNPCSSALDSRFIGKESFFSSKRVMPCVTLNFSFFLLILFLPKEIEVRKLISCINNCSTGRN